MKYYAYNEDGQIVQTGECPPNLLAYQNIPGVTFVAGEADPDIHYVEDSVLKVKPPRPSQFHVFSYKTKSWEPDYDAAVRHVKSVRANLLLESDWTQLPDVPLTTKEAWAAYRQALRDITDQPGFPFDVVWPEPPQLAAEPEPEPAAPVYVEQRRANYPPISAQLDMLWHAMDRGEIPVAEDFYNSVAAVKDAFPKDKTGETVFEVGKMPGA